MSIILWPRLGQIPGPGSITGAQLSRSWLWQQQPAPAPVPVTLATGDGFFLLRVIFSIFYKEPLCCKLAIMEYLTEAIVSLHTHYSPLIQRSALVFEQQGNAESYHRTWDLQSSFLQLR